MSLVIDNLAPGTYRLEQINNDRNKPHSVVGEVLNSVEKFGQSHPELEAAAIAGAAIAVGFIGKRLHIAGAVERFFPKAATLLGDGTEELLGAHAASERLPKFTAKLRGAEPLSQLSHLNQMGNDVAAKPFAASLDKVSEVNAKSESDIFAQPVMTRNADTVAAIFAKHTEAPGWNALNRSRADAEAAADLAREAVPQFPEGTPYTTDRNMLRELTLKHCGKEGLERLLASEAANARRNELFAQSPAPDRLPILQNAFDELTDRFSLPRVKVGFQENLDAAGNYKFGTSDVTVKQSILEDEKHAELFGTSAHEITHVEEASLVAGRVADRLGIKIDATPEQLQALKEGFRSEVGLPLSDDFAASVLKARNGRILSPAESERAEKIAHGIVADQDRMVEHAMAKAEDSQFVELQTDLRHKPTWKILSKYHGDFSIPEDGLNLENEEHVRYLMRLQNPEIDRLANTLRVDEAGKPVAWSDEEDKTARGELRKFLTSRSQEVRKSLKEFETGYYAAFHELEAHETTKSVLAAFHSLGLA